MKTDIRSNAPTTATAPLVLKPLVSSILASIHRPITLTLVLGALPALAMAQSPSGGAVVAGSASIAQPDVNHTVIQQGSDKAVINWQSFSVGKDSYVQFVQPGSHAVTLNRVVGANPSEILGHLSANGQVYLVNPNGIFFGKGAVVDVAGIVATTLDINNDDFMRGDNRFARSPGTTGTGTVVNEGTIKANGGYVVLAGDYAANKGIVQAQLGTVVLASGDALTLQTAGSGLVSYQVDKSTVARLAGVENSGQILANGGRVVMTADVANDLAATVVNNSGLVQAQSVVEHDGAIYFAGQGGAVVNSGRLDASAQAGAKGGHVDLRASGDITHTAGSQITVSGADSGTSNAGSVYTWADGTNHYQQGASISARGGAQGGDGGKVELSGNKVVNRSVVDLRAPKGKLGTLTLDPTAITIADGSGADANDQSTVYEHNLESQLRVGNVVLAATGVDASITLANLSDGVLDGTQGGTGGSLSLTASGGGVPSITFANKANTIKVDGAITLATDNGAGVHSGAIDVGHLDAGSTIDLQAGSVTTGNLQVVKALNSSTNSSHAIKARAYTGDLKVNGDVTVDVVNTTAAGVRTSVALKADSGNVVVTGGVTSKATGLGYYHYDFATDGNPATSQLGSQPWTLVSEGDHAISADLSLQAGKDVKVGAIDVAAKDNHNQFATSLGGYWQTATATQHHFWRPTATNASATVSGENVTIGGTTRVVADGYATSDYSEVERSRSMVDNFNYTSGSQIVTSQSTDGNGNPVNTQRTDHYNNVKGSVKADGGERYIWEFGPYTVINGAQVSNSANVDVRTDEHTSSTQTAMGYAGLGGMSATLDVSATGSVSMNGMNVTSTNRSVTGAASFTDSDWGHQDTAHGLDGTPNSFTSAAREVDYYDTFNTQYSAATSTASATITAGDNASITLGGGASYDVIGQHPGMPGSGLGSASLSIQAGAAGGASGNGTITIANAVNVIGAKNGDVSLNIRNLDGSIEAAGAPMVVTNGHQTSDARAVVQSDNGNVHLDSLAVTAGRAAYLDVTSSGALTVDNASSAVVTGSNSVGLAAVRLNAVGDLAAGDITASSTHERVTQVSGYYDNGQGYGYDYNVDGGSASIDVHSSAGNVRLDGDAKASGYKTATVEVTALAPGKTLTTAAGKTVSSTAHGNTFTSTRYSRYLVVPTYSATTTLTADSGLDLGSDVWASLINRNGVASVDLSTRGGPNAGISQSAGSLVKADGSRGVVTVNAGSATPDSSTAARLDMHGALVAQGAGDTGTVTVNAASGTVSGLGAGSSDNLALVTVNALDSQGTLVVGGSGTIIGNHDSGNGAALVLNAAGSLDSSAANIAISNLSSGADAGARADLAAANGGQRVGSISVNGLHTAVLNATAPGAVEAAGAASSTVNAASGRAESNLRSLASSVGIAAGGAVAATALGSQGSADVNLIGVTGASLQGDATATAQNSGTATVTVTTSGGPNAAISQGAGSTLLAQGTTSLVQINAGDATPTADNSAAFDLRGALRAHASGSAKVLVNGQSGAVHDFSAQSDQGAASVELTSLKGALALTGTGAVSGLSSARVDASSSADLLVAAGAAISAAAAAVHGDAELKLGAVSGMTVNGNLSSHAALGDAAVNLLTTGGRNAMISQGANSVVLADGNQGTIGITAGSLTADATQAAAVRLNGDLQARGSAGTATIGIRAASGSVHDFSAESASQAATVKIASLANNAALVLNGAGRVIANSDNGTGALLKVTSAGALDTAAATLRVNNLSTGGSAGALADLRANGGSTQLGTIAVTAQGAGSASLLAKATTQLGTQGALSVSHLGMGPTGGDAVLDLGAPAAIQLGGTLDVKAADASKRADLRLVSDRLNDNTSRITLSNGNGHVQLASFNTQNIIGVNSARDFDAKVQTNYTLGTLNKWRGQGAEVTFGGEYDRSAWASSVPAIGTWASPSQQTGAIHVAGDSNINLADVKMVFDTTGTTYYHDPRMSSWSVPNGRVATYVARPVTNFDRYLDRTDFSSQKISKLAEQAGDSQRVARLSSGADTGGGYTQVSGDLFLNGEGVNLARNEEDDVSKAGTGTAQ